MLITHLNMSPQSLHHLRSCLQENPFFQLIYYMVIQIWKLNSLMKMKLVFLDHHKRILEAVKSNICTAQQRQKEQYDRKRSCPELFQVGSVVLKKDFRRSKRAGGKLDHRWNGPFKITKCLGRGLYSLERINDPKVVVSRVNGVHLKKYIQSNNVSSQLQALEHIYLPVFYTLA